MKRILTALLLIILLVLSGCKAVKEGKVASTAGFVEQTETEQQDTILPAEPEEQPDTFEKDAPGMGCYAAEKETNSEKEEQHAEKQNVTMQDTVPRVVSGTEEYETGNDAYDYAHCLENKEVAPKYDKSKAHLVYHDSRMVKYEYEQSNPWYSPPSDSEELTEAEYIELARAHCEEFYGAYMPTFKEARFRKTGIANLNNCYQVCFGRYGGKGNYIFVDGVVCNMWIDGKVHSSELLTNEQIQAINLVDLATLEEKALQGFTLPLLWERLGPETTQEFEGEPIYWEYYICPENPSYIQILASSWNDYTMFDLTFHYEYKSGNGEGMEQGAVKLGLRYSDYINS